MGGVRASDDLARTANLRRPQTEMQDLPGGGLVPVGRAMIDVRLSGKTDAGMIDLVALWKRKSGEAYIVGTRVGITVVQIWKTPGGEDG